MCHTEEDMHMEDFKGAGMQLQENKDPLWTLSQFAGKPIFNHATCFSFCVNVAQAA